MRYQSMSSDDPRLPSLRSSEIKGTLTFAASAILLIEYVLIQVATSTIASEPIKQEREMIVTAAYVRLLPLRSGHITTYGYGKFS